MNPILSRGALAQVKAQGHRALASRMQVLPLRATFTSTATQCQHDTTLVGFPWKTTARDIKLGSNGKRRKWKQDLDGGTRWPPPITEPVSPSRPEDPFLALDAASARRWKRLYAKMNCFVGAGSLETRLGNVLSYARSIDPAATKHRKQVLIDMRWLCDLEEQKGPDFEAHVTEGCAFVRRHYYLANEQRKLNKTETVSTKQDPSLAGEIPQAGTEGGKGLPGAAAEAADDGLSASAVVEAVDSSDLENAKEEQVPTTDVLEPTLASVDVGEAPLEPPTPDSVKLDGSSADEMPKALLEAAGAASPVDVILADVESSEAATVAEEQPLETEILQSASGADLPVDVIEETAKMPELEIVKEEQDPAAPDEPTETPKSVQAEESATAPAEAKSQ